MYPGAKPARGTGDFETKVKVLSNIISVLKRGIKKFIIVINISILYINIYDKIYVTETYYQIYSFVARWTEDWQKHKKC